MRERHVYLGEIGACVSRDACIYFFLLFCCTFHPVDFEEGCTTFSLSVCLSLIACHNKPRYLCWDDCHCYARAVGQAKPAFSAMLAAHTACWSTHKAADLRASHGCGNEGERQFFPNHPIKFTVAKVRLIDTSPLILAGGTCHIFPTLPPVCYRPVYLIVVRASRSLH